MAPRNAKYGTEQESFASQTHESSYNEIHHELSLNHRILHYTLSRMKMGGFIERGAYRMGCLKELLRYAYWTKTCHFYPRFAVSTSHRIVSSSAKFLKHFCIYTNKEIFIILSNAH